MKILNHRYIRREGSKCLVKEFYNLWRLNVYIAHNGTFNAILERSHFSILTLCFLWVYRRKQIDIRLRVKVYNKMATDTNCIKPGIFLRKTVSSKEA